MQSPVSSLSSHRHRLVFAAGILGLLGLLVAFVLGHQDSVLIDFKGGLWDAGRAILHGRDPYQPGFLAHQVHLLQTVGGATGATEQTAFSVPLYPAPINLAIVPISLLPFWLAGALYTALSVMAMVVGLRLLGVRDLRCTIVALGSWPFLYGLLLGTIGPWLVLGAGVAWRYRDRLWPPALAIAALVVVKIFPWTLAGWLLVTRRYRALVVAVTVGLVVTLAAWAIVGMDTIVFYPQMLADATVLQIARAMSPGAILVAIGVPESAATAVGLLIAGGLLGMAWRVARRPDGDRQAFALAVIAALVSSPIVWTHYMVLLTVPIALVSPRLSPIWFLPMLSPVFLGIAAAVVPVSTHNTMRQAVMWVVIEVVLAAKVCWPAGSGAQSWRWVAKLRTSGQKTLLRRSSSAS
jgi:hypothetical protein